MREVYKKIDYLLIIILNTQDKSTPKEKSRQEN